MATPPQEPTPRLKEQDKLLKNRHRSEDVIIKTMSKKLLNGSQELFQKAQRRIMRLDLDAQGNIKQTDKNLKAVQDINNFITQGADLITNKAIKELKEGTAELEGFYDDELKSLNTDLPNNTLARIPGMAQTEAVRNTNLKNMSAVSSSFTQEVRRQLTSQLFENIGPEEMAKELKKQLVGVDDKRGNPMTRHAETLARTAYNAYGGAITLQAVDLDEVVAFYYSGPDDLRTRSFCSARVGQVIAKEPLTEAIGAQPGASLHNPGGFNCRHKIMPLSMFDPEAAEFLSDEQRKIVKAAGGDVPDKPAKKKVKKRATATPRSEASYKKALPKTLKTNNIYTVEQDDKLFSKKSPYGKGNPQKSPIHKDNKNALLAVASKGREGIAGESAAVIGADGRIIKGLVVRGSGTSVNSGTLNVLAVSDINRDERAGLISVHVHPKMKRGVSGTFSKGDFQAFENDSNIRNIKKQFAFGEDGDDFYLEVGNGVGKKEWNALKTLRTKAQNKADQVFRDFTRNEQRLATNRGEDGQKALRKAHNERQDVYFDTMHEELSNGIKGYNKKRQGLDDLQVKYERYREGE
jgi:hypothetical protein